MQFKYVWIIAFIIWSIIANVFIIKEFIKAGGHLHKFENTISNNNIIKVGLITNVFFAFIFICVYKLWIVAAIIWGLIGLYAAKELLIDKHEFDWYGFDNEANDDDVTFVTMLWIILTGIAAGGTILISFIVWLASILPPVHILQ